MPTRYKGSEREVLALNTFIKMVRSLNAVQAQLLPALQKDFRLTESQFGVLEAIHHLGPLTQTQLCAKILRSGSNVTTVLDNLERDGLVRRERDTSDRRVQLVHLTPKGAELIATIIPVHVGRIAAVFEALSQQEQSELGRLCRKLGTASMSSL